MASWVDIANAIGAAIGTETRITDPSDDRTLARAIRAVWDLNRLAAIREGSWNFATRRARLPALSDTPEFGFDYQFKLPASCLRLLEVQSGGRQLGGGEYQLEGGKILCDELGPLDVRYLLDVTEPAEWDAAFVEAFTFKVALAIGTKIAGSAFDKSKAKALYDEAISASKRVDALENPPLENDESDWITARDAPAPYGLSR